MWSGSEGEASPARREKKNLDETRRGDTRAGEGRRSERREGRGGEGSKEMASDGKERDGILSGRGQLDGQRYGRQGMGWGGAWVEARARQGKKSRRTRQGETRQSNAT